MTCFVHAQSRRKRRRGVALLGDDVPGNDDVAQRLQSTLRHGNGRFAHGNDMNAQWRPHGLTSNEKEIVLPIELRSHGTRRLDRIQGSEEELANPSVCQFEVAIS
jgi:hypothetical protein